MKTRIEVLAKKENWIDIYKDDIREFLQENFFTTGGQIGHHWNLWINIKTGRIWEEIYPTPNWMHATENPFYKRISHMDYYDSPFNDFRDYVSENDSKEAIDLAFGCDIPADLEYIEQIDWLRENAADAISAYDEAARNEMIEIIVSLIEDEEDLIVDPNL